MYRDYWKLTRAPFETDLNEDLFYASESHQGAVLKLRYLIEYTKGAGILVGESGIGKTYLTHVLEQELAEEFRPLVRILYPRLEATELLAQIAIRLGVEPHEVDSLQHGTDRILSKLVDRIRKLRSEGKTPTILIDDAHTIENPEVWQTLRLLLNFAPYEDSRFTLILMGQPTLLGQIRLIPDLFERVVVRMSVQRFSAAETASYVTHRLKKAGIEHTVFDEAALKSLHQMSVGLPRRINQLADLSLLVGYADGLEVISDKEISGAHEELRSVSHD